MTTTRKLLRGARCNALAWLALCVALSGTSYAAVNLAKGSVTSREVKDRSLKAIDFKKGQLPAGAAGAVGPKGDTGDTGDEGPAGPSGLTLGSAGTGPIEDDVSICSTAPVATASVVLPRAAKVLVTASASLNNTGTSRTYAGSVELRRQDTSAVVAVLPIPTNRGLSGVDTPLVGAGMVLTGTDGASGQVATVPAGSYNAVFSAGAFDGDCSGTQVANIKRPAVSWVAVG
jgi:hypothetical protein